MTLTLNMSNSPVMTGLSDINNYIGTTTSLDMLTTVYSELSDRSWNPYSLQNVTYWASGNQQGISILCSSTSRVQQSCDDSIQFLPGMHIKAWETPVCRFKWNEDTGHDISIWLGFAQNQSVYCNLDEAGSYTLTPTPTPEPTGTAKWCIAIVM